MVHYINITIKTAFLHAQKIPDTLRCFYRKEIGQINNIKKRQNTSVLSIKRLCSSYRLGGIIYAEFFKHLFIGFAEHYRGMEFSTAQS